ARTARPILARNDSPDIPFTQSINPYQGCEHGCIYCYARPSHAYLDLSPGLDFETKLFAKPNAAALLRTELAHPGYRCEPIALGTNTDPYQPIEREWKVTRQVIEVLAECEHPLTITTKGVLILRGLARRAHGDVGHAAAALRGERPLPRLARAALPAARRACDEPRAADARWPRQRSRVRLAHARAGTVCRPDRQALRARVQTAWAQRG